jgi:uncharacterized protein YbbC (DUF1343 family)
MQIHVTDPAAYRSVASAFEIFDAIIETSPGELRFNMPPYEYEHKLMPFDILSGDSVMRESLISRKPVRIEKQRWGAEIEEFKKEFVMMAVYKE